jgi:AAA15 family ATPase/GTPase
MIEDIEINNFRCFDRLKVSGCKRINLISGKNNVGKTALLEAIFLNSTPTKDTIFLMGEWRRESGSFLDVLPAKRWNNFFFQQDITSSCSIEVRLSDRSKLVQISIDRDYEQLLETDNRLRKYLDDRYSDNSVDGKSDNDINPYILLIEVKINSGEAHRTRIVSISYQITDGKDINYLDRVQSSSFIPSSLKSSSVSLTKEFDRARLNEREGEVIKAFQIIDSSIIAVESFSIPEPTIYLKRQGEKRLPLSLFGDAMNRIVDIILKIINNQDSVLLIDEIENGIHHSNQIAFWEFLYRLAEQLNVQIFATTHSLEMTEAFIKAGLNSRSERLCQRQDSAAHFELTRHEKTNKIVAINRDLETLEYGISHHKEVRGGA